MFAFLKIVTMGLILAAVPGSLRDWSVYSLAVLILFAEFGIEPLDHFLRRFPQYRAQTPETTTRGIRFATYLGELSMALIILLRM